MRVPTREQEAVAEALAEKWGGSALSSPDDDGNVEVCGMLDDIEMDPQLINPDGEVIPRASKARIVHAPAPAIGFTVIVEGRVMGHAVTEAEAEQLTLAALQASKAVRLRAATTVSSERDLTPAEQAGVVAAATKCAVSS